MSSTTFNPSDVDLSTADPAQVVCYLELGHNKYDGRLGLRISALFVILVVSSAVSISVTLQHTIDRSADSNLQVTFFPVRSRTGRAAHGT